jgi:hypothetical protein
LEDYTERMLALITKHRDRTLDKLVAVMHKRRIPSRRSALWQFLNRHRIKAVVAAQSSYFDEENVDPCR